jgi:peptidyl-prolyl cis-trans isomerase D
MLEMLRKGAQTWVAKGLFILLVVAFGAWGTNNALTPSSSDSVLTVGDRSVSVNEFRIEFQNQLAVMSRQFNTRMSVEQAKAFGVDQLTLARLASGAALSQLAGEMKLGLSEGRLAQTISENPAFHDENGVYQTEIFYDRLRNAQIRPEVFIKDSADVAVRLQISDAVADGFKPPEAMTEALTRYVNESRGIDYILLSYANIEPVKVPADDVLGKWFEENKARYLAPEYRKIAYVKLEPSDIADPSSVTDAMVAEDYEKHKDSYRTPETRTIEQLTFVDRASADAAAARLSSGTTFDQLVAEQGKTATDVLLGDFTRETMPSPGMAEAAFKVTADGGMTGVADGVVGPVILRVSNIRPETVKPLDAVKDDIRKQLATAAATEEIQNVYDAFEDSRASGATLEETATKLNLKAVVIDAVDNRGNDKSGNAVKDLPSAQLVSEAFKTDPGVEALPITLSDSGYAWFETLSVDPSRERTLDEVREKVIADWTEAQQKSALVRKAAELADRIKNGAKLADIAAELALVVEKKSGITRSTQDTILSSAAIAATFGGGLNYVTAATGTDPGTQILLQVTEINPEATSEIPEENTQRIEALAKAAGDDILEQLVDGLQKQYGVTYNRTLADRAMTQ